MTRNKTSNSHYGPVLMSCEEFQAQLPDFFASGDKAFTEDSPLHKHLESCDLCSALVRDLQYIAEQAALLLKPAEEEPSDDVWKKIQESIDHERDYPEEEQAQDEDAAALKGKP